MPAHIFKLIAFIAILIPSIRALAQADPAGPEIDADAEYNSPLLFLVPQARDMTVPDWVKPGTRLTLYGMAGSTPEGGSSLEKSDKGEWVDPATGDRYSKVDAVGAGGEGFAQFDVIAVGKHGVAISSNLYTIIQPGNPPQLLHTPMGGMTAAGAGPADLWVHPAILAQAKQFHTPGFFMLRGNYTLPQGVFDCLCLVNRGSGSYSSHAYDMKTGVLVSSTVTSQGKVANIRLPNEDAQRGNKGTTITKFVSIRQLNTPGVNGTNPPWVNNLRITHFAGQCQYVNQYDPNIQMTFPAKMDVTLGKRGVNWCSFVAKTVIQMPGAPPQQSQLNGMCGPAGAFWIDPRALTNLQPGQVLDEDPVTRIRTLVANANAQQVQIAITGPGVGGQALYDRNTGMLQAIQSVQRSTGMTTMLQLQGTE